MTAISSEKEEKNREYSAIRYHYYMSNGIVLFEIRFYLA